MVDEGEGDEGRNKENKNCQTEEEDDPHIVYKLYKRIGELRSKIDFRDEQTQALTQALEACESQLKTECQQSAVLSSAVREHEHLWMRSQQRCSQCTPVVTPTTVTQSASGSRADEV